MAQKGEKTLGKKPIDQCSSAFSLLLICGVIFSLKTNLLLYMTSKGEARDWYWHHPSLIALFEVFFESSSLKMQARKKYWFDAEKSQKSQSIWIYG